MPPPIAMMKTKMMRTAQKTPQKPTTTKMTIKKIVPPQPSRNHAITGTQAATLATTMTTTRTIPKIPAATTLLLQPYSPLRHSLAQSR